MSPRPLNVLWLTDHCCYDGSLHAGGKLFYNLAPVFDRERILQKVRHIYKPVITDFRGYQGGIP